MMTAGKLLILSECYNLSMHVTFNLNGINQKLVIRCLDRGSLIIKNKASYHALIYKMHSLFRLFLRDIQYIQIGCNRYIMRLLTIYRTCYLFSCLIVVNYCPRAQQKCNVLYSQYLKILLRCFWKSFVFSLLSFVPDSLQSRSAANKKVCILNFFEINGYSKLQLA